MRQRMFVVFGVLTFSLLTLGVLNNLSQRLSNNIQVVLGSIH